MFSLRRNKLPLWMATPTETDLPRLKRIARYLVEAERVVWHFSETDDEPDAVEAFVGQ